MRLRGLGILAITVLVGFSPALADISSKDKENGPSARVMSTPMEPLLPCTSNDELIVYTLKADDQKNIQVAIECSSGVLTAKWPSADSKTLEDVEVP